MYGKRKKKKLVKTIGSRLRRKIDDGGKRYTRKARVRIVVKKERKYGEKKWK